MSEDENTWRCGECGVCFESSTDARMRHLWEAHNISARSVSVAYPDGSMRYGWRRTPWRRLFGWLRALAP